ncbi:MAG: SPOR domain-containing protein [Xanthomonadales bacterium]|nr:SPOR domain-containing protein [Xanthomonadales bacterium]
MDKALKQRLVGASVLIILAVIVLPMLLSGRSDRLKHESSQIELPPKPEELSIETRRFPVGIPNKPLPAAKQATDELEETLSKDSGAGIDTGLASVDTEKEIPVQQPEVAITEASEMALETDDSTTASMEPVESQASADSVEKPPEVTSITLASDKPEALELTQAVEPSKAGSRYLVQVASFSNERNANALATLLKAENLSVLMDVVDRPAGRMYRVRVGPYSKRSEADSLVSSLSAKMTDLTPRVLDLRPDESAPVSTPSDPLVRWVVQVGSFSQEKSADDLVARLRLAGLSAFSEKVSSSAGTAYKVRIGPELDRDRAAELARRVKSEHNLDAFVTTQE